jgi:hypothetical protein
MIHAFPAARFEASIDRKKIRAGINKSDSFASIMQK